MCYTGRLTVIRYDLIVCGDKDEMAAEAARERIQSMCAECEWQIFIPLTAPLSSSRHYGHFAPFPTPLTLHSYSSQHTALQLSTDDR